ncbi:hypothetical protein D3C73_1455280 [compost metagenome]
MRVSFNSVPFRTAVREPAETAKPLWLISGSTTSSGALFDSDDARGRRIIASTRARSSRGRKGLVR